MPFRGIDDPVKLRRLLEAVLLLEGELSLPALLRHFVEEARAMSGARYGALGVLDDDGVGLREFITVGMTPDAEGTIGPRPTGRGVLGLLITQPQPVRMADIGQHLDSAGFPPGHPPMTSFLGVPVGVRDEIYGNLYLTDKVGWSEFTADDESLVVALAQAAGIAIENARLHEQVQTIAVLEDRDRIARDLHDAVIQRLFAVGLSLQSLARPPVTAAAIERLNQATADIDGTIRQIRSSIFELGSVSGGGPGLRARLVAVVRELHPVVGFEIPVAYGGPVDTAVPDAVADHLLVCVREALTNVGRHAHASRASVSLRADADRCTLTVADNGGGMGAHAGGERPGGGLGIPNLRRRAEKLGGDLSVTSSPGGTTLVWSVPLQ